MATGPAFRLVVIRGYYKGMAEDWAARASGLRVGDDPVPFEPARIESRPPPAPRRDDLADWPVWEAIGIRILRRILRAV